MTQCHTGVLASLVKIMPREEEKKHSSCRLGRMGPVKPYSMSDRFNILNMLCEPFFLHHIRWCVFFYSHAVSWPTCISPVSPRATGLAASVAASFTLSLLQWSKTSTTYSGSASVTVLKWKQENVNHSCRLMNSLIRDSVRTYLHIRFLAEVYDNPPAEVKVLISDLWCHK